MDAAYLPADRKRVPGAIPVGDAYNMRHPLTGGGMMVAFSDVYHLTNLLEGVDLYNHRCFP